MVTLPTHRFVAVLLATIVLAGTMPAGVAADGDGDVAAKQIVFVSGEAFLADGYLDREERRVIADSIIVPGGGVAYDDAAVTDASDDVVASLSPYFAAKELDFLEPQFDQKYGPTDADRALLVNAVVITPHTKFALNGEQVTLSPPAKCGIEACTDTDIHTVRDDPLPDWYTDALVPGFGSFVTPGGTLAPGRTTNDVAAKQIVFITAADLADDDYLTEVELAAIDDGYVVAPTGTYPDTSMPIEDGFDEPSLPLAFLSTLGDQTDGLAYAPAADVLAAGSVSEDAMASLEQTLIVASGSTYLQDGERVQASARYVVIDKDTTMTIERDTTTAPSITLVHAAPSDKPDWLETGTGELVTDSDNMVTNPDNMAPSDPVLVSGGGGIVFVMPGDNAQVPGGGVAYLDAQRDVDGSNAIALFAGSPDTFLKAKKAFLKAKKAFDGGDGDYELDPGNEVTENPDPKFTTPGKTIPTPERDTIPGTSKTFADATATNPGVGTLDGEDKLFATRVRKAFDGTYGYGFVALDTDSGTFVFGYVSDGVLVTDPERMDPGVAPTILEEITSGSGDDKNERP